MKAYKYRLYPTTKQEAVLLYWLELCRRLYNHALTERRTHYKATGHGLGYEAQANTLPIYKNEHQEYVAVHSQILQNVLVRLDRAFINFFEGRARYPKYKKYGRCRSITYPQIKPEDIGGHSVTLSKIGRMRIAKHRSVKGTPKTATVILQPCGKWYVTITAETAKIIKQPITTAKHPVGADSGIINYIYLSDGTHVDNPRFLSQHEKRIKKAQRILSKKQKIQKTITTRTGETVTVTVRSKNWLKTKCLLANRWQDYVHVKENWQWNQTRRLVKLYDFIAYEDLRIRNMMKNHNIARSIQDASWGGFWMKVENLVAQTDSKHTWKVNPQYTTQRCSRCNHRNRIALSERTYRCQNCGFVAPRDGNSANLVIAIACSESGLRHTQPVGMGDPEYTPVEIGPTLPETERSMRVASLVVEAGSKGSPCADNPGNGGQRTGKPPTSVVGGCHLVRHRQERRSGKCSKNSGIASAQEALGFENRSVYM